MLALLDLDNVVTLFSFIEALMTAAQPMRQPLVRSTCALIKAAT
jgi:hypothetical protein